MPSDNKRQYGNAKLIYFFSKRIVTQLRWDNLITVRSCRKTVTESNTSRH